MDSVETLFRNRKADPERLLSFGFVRSQKGYLYSADLMNGQFEMNVAVSKNGEVTAAVVDAFTKENYVLINVREAAGKFVGQVRAEYETRLAEIAEHCFNREVFKSSQAQNIIAHIKNKYGDELEFLWPKLPKTAIFRRKDTSKWYATLQNVSGQKIGLSTEKPVDILDLRIDPAVVDTVVDGKKYFPGYHMNKKHWFTISLDGSVQEEEIYAWIDSSYSRARK